MTNVPRGRARRGRGLFRGTASRVGMMTLLVAGTVAMAPAPTTAAVPPRPADAVVSSPGNGVRAATPVESPVPQAAVTDDPLTIQVVTFGPGAHPFTRFGHNAIRVIDRRAGTDIVYNFGTFAFGSPRLILDFLEGRLRYWLSRSSMAATVRLYRREDRTIELQELDLSPAQKLELATRLEVNALPQNREYRYDYFADNCSTRVRDAIDAVVHGQLRASASAQGSMTLRRHALRMTADDVPLYTALLIVLGPRTDRPIDEWAEDFLPEMLQRTLRGAQTGGGASGAGHLVKNEETLFQAQRPAPRREPPNRLPAFLAAGVVTGLLMFLLGRLGARQPVWRFLFGLLLSLWGLVLGGIGCFLSGVWALTPHAVAYRNENVLLYAPFSLALAVLGMGVGLGRPGAMRKAFLVSATALGLVGVACALKMFPWSRQENGALILVMLPLWWGITAGTRAVAGLRTTSAK